MLSQLYAVVEPLARDEELDLKHRVQEEFVELYRTGSHADLFEELATYLYIFEQAIYSSRSPAPAKAALALHHTPPRPAPTSDSPALPSPPRLISPQV